MNTQALTITEKGLTLKIGRKVNNSVNVFTEFNPLKKLPLVDMINDCSVVIEVYNVASYSNNTGGLAINLKPGITENDLKLAIEEIIRTLII